MLVCGKGIADVQNVYLILRTITLPFETDKAIFLGKSKAVATVKDEKYLHEVNTFINILN